MTIYRKPTFSGAFTHHESYIDQSYKKALIFTLFSRYYSICSDYTHFHLEVEKLREIFRKNGYPSGIIELSIRTFLSTLYFQKTNIFNSSTYYGKTEHHLNVRSGEHTGLSSLTGNRVACKPSAISDYLLLHEQNNSSFNDFSILCCGNNTFKLSLRKLILIKKDSPELNRNVSSMPLLLFNLLVYSHHWNIDNLFIIYNPTKTVLISFYKIICVIMTAVVSQKLIK